MQKERSYLHMVIGTPSTTITETSRAVYFTKAGDAAYIPDADTAEEAHNIMCRSFDMGTANRDSITELQSLFERVILKNWFRIRGTTVS